MYYEIFKFELKYRLKRPETYLFFIFLLGFSLFGVDFIMQGVELGGMKKNAPIVIAKVMGAITGFFLILASMIMGVPILRDDQYQITPMLYTTPIGKSDLLIGRFGGSFVILFFIFCAVPLGMMLGELMPWHLDSEMSSFRVEPYLSAFFTMLLPSLFFGSSVFFVTGMLSRKLLVVYTQGIFIFVLFLLTKAISNELLQAVMDPFSLTTTTYMTKSWSVMEKNTLLVPFTGALLLNKIFWSGLGVVALVFGYFRFNFDYINKSKKSFKRKSEISSDPSMQAIEIPMVVSQSGWASRWNQFVSLSLFYCKFLLRETSFWAIVICAAIIILVNSINLGTVYGVNSYPATYLIIEELQEMSNYFFVIILLFYSAELFWKEKSVGIEQMVDASPISSFIGLMSKVTGLTGVYVVLMISVIASGVLFQISKGYYHLDLSLYFSGFFFEILPFLVLYTIAAFFFQALFNNKFLGIIITLIFFIVMMLLEPLGFYHVLLSFGGGGLRSYSEMNGYGQFLKPYLWIKSYWFLFGILLLLLASLFTRRGHDLGWRGRFRMVKPNFSKQLKILMILLCVPLLSLACFLFFQVHILNQVKGMDEQKSFRTSYEKELKPFQYLPQLEITTVDLSLDIFPENRSYELEGSYVLKNENEIEISEVHVQKKIESDVVLEYVEFSVETNLNNKYKNFSYSIYELKTAIQPGDSIVMNFKQKLVSKGFSNASDEGPVLYNGSRINNHDFPSLSYDNQYELRDSASRVFHGLKPRIVQASLDDENALELSRSGSDSKGVRSRMIISTSLDQKAVTSGRLIKHWVENDRQYYEYSSKTPIINFYSILSGDYALLKDKWNSTQEESKQVELEIYYHPRHRFNLDRMMNGMKSSLDYFSSNFSDYQYDVLKIVEIPRYNQVAQSLPNTIQLSESLGFILDIDDENDLDMAFFITAHEVAHQWWGMQVEAANVKGRNFILETLAQYSALMVFKQQFSQEKYEQLIAFQQERYEEGSSRRGEKEPPLYLVEDQDYLYYHKGAVIMSQLEKLIGEQQINLALQSFINDWNSRAGISKIKNDRYATSVNLISAILEFTKDKDKQAVRSMLMES